MASLPDLDAQGFDERAAVIDRPLLVDFWAPWCGSCRLLMPSVNRVAQELADRMDVVKVDVDAEPVLAERLGVMSLPTLVLYREGQEITRIAGVKSRDSLIETLSPHLPTP